MFSVELIIVFLKVIVQFAELFLPKDSLSLPPKKHWVNADPRSKDACFDKGGHQGLSSVSLSNTTLSLCFEFNETVFVQYHSGAAAPFELPY